MTKEQKREYNKKYYEANKEVVTEREKRYYEANPDYRRKYYQANKEAIVEHQKKYYEANKEVVADYQKEYREANKKVVAERSKKYNEANKEALADYQKKYQQQRRAADPAFKLIANLRIRHNAVLKGQHSTTKGLGCDSNFLREHLENQWIEGMTWNNYGSKEGQWSLDHRLPLSLYYTQPELLPKLIHYTNMQPMWHVNNLKKGCRIDS